MIDKKEEDTLMTAFDALDADLGKLLAHYRKLKRDRKALLEASKRAINTLLKAGYDPDVKGGSVDMLNRAIAQAESDE